MVCLEEKYTGIEPARCIYCFHVAVHHAGSVCLIRIALQFSFDTSPVPRSAFARAHELRAHSSLKG